MFRDSQTFCGKPINQIPRFFRQINEQELPPHIIINDVICVYTKSNDDTEKALEQKKNSSIYNVEIYNCDNTYSGVISITDKNRLMGLSKCANVGFEKAKKDCDYLFLIESDLIIYNSLLIYNLLNTFSELDNVGCVSPLVFLDTKRECFYDTFCFRSQDGKMWTNNKPWCIDFDKCEKYIEMSCVGSCSLINKEVLSKNIDFGNRGYLDFCEKIIKEKKKIIVNKDCVIYHPSKQNINGRWI